jgi:heme A synthase
MIHIILAAATFAALLLFYGAWMRFRRKDASQQKWLMIAAALVILANVAIWAVPDKNGNSLGSYNQ